MSRLKLIFNFWRTALRTKTAQRSFRYEKVLLWARHVTCNRGKGYPSSVQRWPLPPHPSVATGLTEVPPPTPWLQGVPPSPLCPLATGITEVNPPLVAGMTGVPFPLTGLTGVPSPPKGTWDHRTRGTLLPRKDPGPVVMW